jgi:putative aldouronate transport system permease protein
MANIIKILKKHKYLYIMLAPGIVFLFIFNYIPMYGVRIAFQDYFPWGVSEWVGFKHFVHLFNNREFFRIIRNTLLIASYKLIFAFPAPIILALLLNELRTGILKRFVQTVSYLPYFISWMVVAGIAYNFLASDLGFLNVILDMLGLQKIDWYYRPDLWRGILVVTGIWKNVGWGSIIYLAALSGISPEMYEASDIDGAGKIKQLFNITLPSISNIITIMLILHMGSFIKEDFQQIYSLMGNNTIIRETIDVLETNILRNVQLKGFYSMPAALGLLQSIAALILVLGSNYLARKAGKEGLF